MPITSPGSHGPGLYRHKCNIIEVKTECYITSLKMNNKMNAHNLETAIRRRDQQGEGE